MNLLNHIKYGDYGNVRHNLVEIAEELTMLSSAIPQLPLDDYIGFITKKILNYAAEDISRASNLIPTDIRCFAWRARNVFEAFLHLAYIDENVERAK